MAAWAALLGAGCSRVAGSWELGVAGWAALSGAGYGRVAGSWVWPGGPRCREPGTAALPGAGCGRVGRVAGSWAHCLSAVEQIDFECTATPENDGVAFTAGLADCGEPLVQLLGRQASILRKFCDGHRDESVVVPRPGPGTEKAKALVRRRLDDLIAAAYARFYAYPFKDLPRCWRQLYTDASILKFVLLYMSWSDVGARAVEHGSDTAEKELDDMIKTLDLALILAGAAGDRRGRQWVDKAFALLERVWQMSAAHSPTAATTDERPSKRARTADEPNPSPWQDTPSFSRHEPFTPPVKHPVQRVHDISFDDFQSYMTPPQKDKTHPGPLPLVITGLTDAWPARTTHPWNKPAYLLARTLNGRRLVPIELGRSYVDAGWSQQLVPFGAFLTTHITTTTNPPFPPDATPPQQTGYLAQHPLLTHLPSLRADMRIPDLCHTAPPGHPTDPSQDQPPLGDGDGEGPRLNAWLGPPGTITPLHTDPYHNLLAQVVGRKYVRLYAPWVGAARMRARGREGGVEMGNTSLVDVGVVEGWDVGDDGDGEGEGEGEGEFEEVEYLDCVLAEGDVLYIPIGWWHYVRGLSVSFSVSFWWN
ncbi:Clavaminate synthase-like protein [Trichocladium antarcticum]|uniref:Clavaminate synthase-like protein n=1 Tax=Trichocladium antarcticum TaxID=1450529 RepID=A0AAN6UBP0_9PEZI|nr:Clavaminate synthase-like protein [Trichocladium antarcticum]